MTHLTESIIYRSDSYKYSHHKLLPPGTETVYSYLESRGGKFRDVVFLASNTFWYSTSAASL